MMMLNAQHHVGIHGDETPVAVLGEAAVAGFFRHRLDRHVVEAEIEHRVHHARHRGARAGAHRHQQRILRVAEFFPGDAADHGKRRLDLGLQILRIGFVVGVEIGADLGGDGEAGRHRQAEMRHLGKPRALAAEEVAHRGAPLRLAAAERIDPLALAGGRHGRLARPDFGRARLGATASGSGLLHRRFFHRLTRVFGARFGHECLGFCGLALKQ